MQPLARLATTDSASYDEKIVLSFMSDLAASRSNTSPTHYANFLFLLLSGCFDALDSFNDRLTNAGLTVSGKICEVVLRLCHGFSASIEFR